VRRDSIFRFRLSEEEAARLDGEAKEMGLSKADRIRKALGWPLADRPTRTAPVRDVVAKAPTEAVDADREPGKAAMQALAKRLGRRS
jgi:hypothetical protein